MIGKAATYTCRLCNVTKALRGFYKRNGKRHGRVCRQCHINRKSARYYNENYEQNKALNKLSGMDWAKANPDKVRASIQKWRKNNPDKVKLQRERERAKRLINIMEMA